MTSMFIHKIETFPEMRLSPFVEGLLSKLFSATFLGDRNHQVELNI